MEDQHGSTRSDVAWSLWHVLTAKAGAVTWTEAELARAINQPQDAVMDGVSELYLSGHVTTAFPNEGWRRA